MEVENNHISEELRVALENAKDENEAAAILNAHGYPVTAEQLQATTEGELNEDSLDEVAGGIIITAGAAAAGAAVGVAIAIWKYCRKR